MNAIFRALLSVPLYADCLFKQGIPWKKISHNIVIGCLVQLLAKKNTCNTETKQELFGNVKNATSVITAYSLIMY